jgi:hypothetical protein
MAISVCQYAPSFRLRTKMKVKPNECSASSWKLTCYVEYITSRIIAYSRTVTLVQGRIAPSYVRPLSDVACTLTILLFASLVVQTLLWLERGWRVGESMERGMESLGRLGRGER